MLRDLLIRLRSLFRRASVEKEMEDELRFHLERQMEKYVAAGMPREEAARRARIELGGLEQVREECRDARGTRLLDSLLQDVRYGARLLRRSPGFTAVAILTLALGIGANTAIFSVVNAVVLRPLPFLDPGRLVEFNGVSHDTGRQSEWVSYRDVADWRERSRSFEAIGAQRFALLNFAGAGEPEALYGAAVSYDLFRVLGVRPILGREFGRTDDRPGADLVVILSYALWQDRFGGDPGVIGKRIPLRGVAAADREVIGVMPPGFNFPLTVPSSVSLPSRQMAFWVPIGLDPNQQARDGVTCRVVGRLRKDVTLKQAQAELDSIAGQLARENPATNTGRGILLAPLKDHILGKAEPVMLLLLAAAGMVILTACANLANLLLARALDRTREMGIRVALGAGRARLVRQGLTESLLLGLLGGVAGVLLARALLPVLLRLAPQDLPRLGQTHIDAGVLGFALALSVVVAVLFGTLPAWRATDLSLEGGFSERGAGRASGKRHVRSREALIVAEIAAAVILTISAGLVTRSFVGLQRVDPGYEPDRLETAIIVLFDSRYPTNSSKVEFYREVLKRVRTLPGVTSAGAADGVPLSGNVAERFIEIEGRLSAASGDNRPGAEIFSVMPGYVETLGVPLVRGRELNEDDTANAPLVALISETAARQFWPGEDPLGKRVRLDGQQSPWRSVVGIVKDTRNRGLDLPAVPAVYLPAAQGINPPQFLVARTAIPSGQLARSLRQAVAEVDRGQPVFVVNSMNDLLGNSIAERRFSVFVLVAFGGLALTLAAVGVYGLVAYSVSSRRNEIGLRMALGAQPSSILRLVLEKGAKLALLGIVTGTVTALALARLLEGMLFGITPSDPATFAGVAALLAVIALTASYLPARRAMRMDPAVALHHE